MSAVAKPDTLQRASPGPDISLDELQLAVRNHSMPLEALQYPITPIGLHYLLTHFDIPRIDAAEWKLVIGGQVRNPLTLTLAGLQRRPAGGGKAGAHVVWAVPRRGRPLPRPPAGAPLSRPQSRGRGGGAGDPDAASIPDGAAGHPRFPAAKPPARPWHVHPGRSGVVGPRTCRPRRSQHRRRPFLGRRRAWRRRRRLRLAIVALQVAGR